MKKNSMNFITFLLLSISTFFLGLTGIFLNRKNIIIVLISIELILLSVNFSFLITSCFVDDRIGQLFAIFILTLAAIESSIGLAILLTYFRVRGTTTLELVNLLKG